MKITVFSNRLYDCGASIAALRASRALVQAGMTVDHRYEVGRFVPEVTQCFPEVALGSMGAHAPKAPRDTYLKRLQRETPDAVIVHNFEHSHAIVADMAECAPLLWMMHDLSPITGLHYSMPAIDRDRVVSYPSRKGVPSFSFFETAVTRRMGFAAPSEWLLRLARHYLMPGTPTFLVPNCIHEAHFAPRDRNVARTLTGLRPDAFVVLFFAGRGAVERKNLLTLMQALFQISDPALQILVVGGLPPSDVPIDPRCIFLPGFSQQADPIRASMLYSAADLFLLPSLMDNLPNTALESLACGTPVLAGRIGGTREAVRDGETGWLFDPYSPADLAMKLQELMRSDELEQIGARGCALVAETYSTERCAAAYLDALEQLADRTPPLKAAATPERRQDAAVASPIYPERMTGLARSEAVTLNRWHNPDGHTAVYRTKWNPGLSQRRWTSFASRMAATGHPIRGNEARIDRWRNAYRGRRAFLIGNGPSLNKCDLTLLRDEITIGVNSIFLKADELGGLPTHYVVEDFFVAEDRAAQINALNGTNKWFGNYLSYCLEGQDVHWMNVRMRYDGYKGFPYFSTDATRQLWAGGSVTYICMQLAFFFGIETLYLIGFDHHYVIPETTDVDGNNLTSLGDDPNHFDSTYFGKGLRWHDPKTERMELGYARAARTFEQHGRRILNATVGGQLEILERVDYRSLFSQETLVEIDS